MRTLLVSTKESRYKRIALRALLLAISTTAATAIIPASAADITIGNNDYITLNGSSITNSSIVNLIGTPRPDLREIKFNQTTTWNGRVIMNDHMVFNNVGSRFTLNGTGTGAFLFSQGSSLHVANQTLLADNTFGGAFSILNQSQHFVFRGDGNMPADGWNTANTTFNGDLNLASNIITGSNSGGGALAAYSDNQNAKETEIGFIGIRSLNVSNNNANGTNSVGGAFYIRSESIAPLASLLIYAKESVKFENNYAASHGGAIYQTLASTSGQPTNQIDGQISIHSENSILLKNNSTGGTLNNGYLNAGAGNGGAIYLSADDISAARKLNTFIYLNGKNINIQENRASNGGAIYHEGNQIVLGLTSDKFSINENKAANAGGAIYSKGGGASAFIQLQAKSGDSFIKNNQAALGQGASTETGGAFHIETNEEPAAIQIYAGDYNPATTASITIEGNKAGTVPRAIYLKNNGAAPTLTGSITLNAMTSGSFINLHDEIKAVKNAQNSKGYSVYINSPIRDNNNNISYQPIGTFAQIGVNSRVFVPGDAMVSAGVHSLFGGAVFRTYEEGTSATPFGNYTLKEAATLAVENTGSSVIQNTLSSAKFHFETNSTISFQLGTNFAPNNSIALLKLEGGALPDATSGTVLPGNNKIAITGNVTAKGNYYLIDATDLNKSDTTKAAVGKGNSGTLDVSNLTLNGNSVSTAGSSTSGRKYITGRLEDHDPAGANTKNKLFLVIEDIGGNIENTWRNNVQGAKWINDTSTANYWNGTLKTTSQTSVSIDTFLNGDLVIFNNTNETIPITSDVIVARMTTNGATITFTGDKRISGSTTSSTFNEFHKPTLESQVDGTLHINGGSVTVQNTIDFSGKTSSTNPLEKIGVQVTYNGRIVLGDSGHFGTSDAQNINVEAGSKVEFNSRPDYTYKGVISGAGAVEKRNAGTLTLTANQTYTGALVVAGGTLVLGDKTAGITQDAKGGSVSSGTTLAGIGRVTKDGTFTISGKISPGNSAKSIGTLNFAENGGKVILESGAEFVVELTKSPSGISADLIQTTVGDIEIKNGATLTIANFALIGGATLSDRDEFPIALAGGNAIIGGFGNGTIWDAAHTQEFEIIKRTAAGDIVDDSTLGKTILLRRKPGAPPSGGGTPDPVVPEPSTYALCSAIGALGFALYRRRRKTSSN